MSSDKSLNNRRFKFKVMYKNRSNLDGIAFVFFLAGVFILVSNQNTNVGWVLIIIGIVKQLIEWGK